MYTISPKKSVETSAGLFCPVHEIMSCNRKNQVPLMAVVDMAEDKVTDKVVDKVTDKAVDKVTDKLEDKEMDQIDHSY